MNIKRYQALRDYDNLLTLLKQEGDEWQCYHADDVKDMYKKLLRKSITFVLYDHDLLIGYIRCLHDFGFYVYVCDLLVDKNYRGHAYGRYLMENVVKHYPHHIVYVMSDVDAYYTSLGYEREGSIFTVK